MKYYAIQEKATGRFVSGTDFSRADGKTRQIYASPERAPLLLSWFPLCKEIKRGHIDTERYQVVVVEIQVVGS